MRERKEKGVEGEKIVKGRRAENQSNRRTSDSGSVPFQSWHSPSSNLGTFPTSQAPVEMLTLHMMTTHSLCTCNSHSICMSTGSQVDNSWFHPLLHVIPTLPTSHTHTPIPHSNPPTHIHECFPLSHIPPPLPTHTHTHTHTHTTFPYHSSDNVYSSSFLLLYFLLKLLNLQFFPSV